LRIRLPAIAAIAALQPIMKSRREVGIVHSKSAGVAGARDQRHLM
jgi:hypothetical protein